MIFLRPRLKEFRLLKLSCLGEHTLSLDSFLKSRRFIFFVPTVFVLGICNAETSPNKDTFKQLGDIFQCICINRRSLIHFFLQFLNALHLRWDSGSWVFFLCSSSLQNMLEERKWMFSEGCVIVVIQLEQSWAQRGLLSKTLLVCGWVMSNEHTLKHWGWGDLGSSKATYRAVH